MAAGAGAGAAVGAAAAAAVEVEVEVEVEATASVVIEGWQRWREHAHCQFFLSRVPFSFESPCVTITGNPWTKRLDANMRAAASENGTNHA